MTMLGAMDCISVPMPNHWKKIGVDVRGCLYTGDANETTMTRA